RSALRGRSDAWLMLIGVGGLIVAGIHDTIDFVGLASDKWTPYGLALFVLAPAVLLAGGMRQEEALRRSNARYDTAMLAINEGVYDWDVKNGTIFYSDSVYRALGVPKSMKTPLDWRDRVHPEDRASYDAAIKAHFKGETERFECDYRYR